jgi:hypothetical protein
MFADQKMPEFVMTFEHGLISTQGCVDRMLSEGGLRSKGMSVQVRCLIENLHMTFNEHALQPDPWKPKTKGKHHEAMSPIFQCIEREGADGRDAHMSCSPYTSSTHGGDERRSDVVIRRGGLNTPLIKDSELHPGQVMSVLGRNLWGVDNWEATFLRTFLATKEGEALTQQQSYHYDEYDSVNPCISSLLRTMEEKLIVCTMLPLQDRNICFVFGTGLLFRVSLPIGPISVMLYCWLLSCCIGVMLYWQHPKCYW